MRKKIILYDSDESELNVDEQPKELERFWTSLYRSRNNNIEEVWNMEKRNEYEQQQEDIQEKMKEHLRIEENGNQTDWRVNPILREHLDVVIQCEKVAVQPMGDADIQITSQEIKRQLQKTRNKKAPGPDGIKPELFKLLYDSNIYIEHLRKSFNKIIEEEEINENWKTSNTTLIQKKSKPTVADLMNSSYKIFMGILRQKLEKHIKATDSISDLQAGFTQDRRITDNLYILKYCIEESYKMKKELIVTSLDFRKAFDSVDRQNLITALMAHNIHPKIIHIITKIYTDDHTNILLNGEKQTTIHITNGIRQGCNASTFLFIILTYQIINELQKRNIGFKDDNFQIPILYYADDSLLLSHSVEEAAQNIQYVHQVAH